MIKKKIFLLAFSFIALNSYSQEVSKSFQLKDQIKKVTRKVLMNDLRAFIAAGGKSRMVGQPGHKTVVEFLKTYIGKRAKIELFKPDIEAAKEMYRKDLADFFNATKNKNDPAIKKWEGFTGYMVKYLEKYKSIQGINISYLKEGLDKSKKMVITAHYDTISHDKKTLRVLEGVSMPGADYNASGVSVALEIINVLKNITPKYSVEVVLLDYQALGFLGSRHLASKLKDDKSVVGVINLEMLGHDSKALDKTEKYGNMAAYMRKLDNKHHPDDLKLALIFQKQNSRCKNSVVFDAKPNNFKNSDNVSFWEQEIPAITLSQNWEDDFNEKGYQTPNDFVETLNQKTLYESFRYIGCVIGAWSLGL